MKFDLYYEIMTPEDWTPEIERRLYREVLEQIVLADEMGFSTIWFVRHHGRAGYAHSPCPDVFLGAVSQRTRQIRLGFGVEVLPYHHPFFVAERVAVVDVLSGGRVECGTGRGSGAERASKILGISPEESSERWMESIKVIAELWTKRDVVHQGKYWGWDEPQTLVPRPIQSPHPPLWYAASSSSSVANAGRYGLGLMLSGYKSLATIAENVSVYRDEVDAPTSQIGYAKNDRVVAATSWLCHDPGDDAMAERMRQAVMFWARRDVTLGRGRTSSAALDLGGQKSRAEMSDQQLLDDDSGIIRVGDPDYFVATAKRYEEAGVNQMMLQMQLSSLGHDDTMRSIELFGKHVIPATRDRDPAGASEAAAQAAVGAA
jgi:alkanesulfonate monooxygenase SsuD/methylene tetrahydromethanopterin reductase-like flavin-dependent oxidoreductase (luciferase family)